jgi:hypothetical protein
MALSNYTIALEKYNILKSQLTSNTDLFKLDPNILYNDNPDIIESLYAQLIEISNDDQSRQLSKNYQFYLATHVFNKMEFFLKNKKWIAADNTYRQYIDYNIKNERNNSLKNSKNLYCPYFQKLDNLWVKYSEGLYGFRVQKKIYLETGNKLNIDKVSNTDEKSFDHFATRVGWKDIKDFDEWDKIVKGEISVPEKKQQFAKGFFPIRSALRDDRESIIESSGGMFGKDGWLFRNDDFARESRGRASFYLNRNMLLCEW